MIGVFDSGYGGLSVFKELLLLFPEYSFMYLGDNARAPYGSRSPEIVTEYTRESIEWLFGNGAEIVILACNTASGEALSNLSRFLKEKFPKKVVLGVIEPVARFVSENVPREEKIAVIGTISTIRSGKYREALQKYGFTNVIERPTPLLAPLVETGDVTGPMAEHMVAGALSPLTREGISTVILGCTHYYFLRNTIEKLYPHLKLIDAPEAFPIFFREFLVKQLDRTVRLKKGDAPRFYTTDEEDAFARFVERTLGLSIAPKRVKLS
jgi:glutamate racemase